MTVDGWALAVPVLTEMLLLALAGVALMRLHRLRLEGVWRLTLAAVMVDAVGQVWHMAGHVGRPVGVSWLVHVALSYLMVYILYRLGDLLCRIGAEAPVCSSATTGMRQ